MNPSEIINFKIFYPKIMAEKVYIGKVIKKIERSGPGGPITLCQLELTEEKRTLQRAIMGPVQEGDLIMLLDSEREHRRGKF
ncbi:40S ribosomal protein S28 [Trachipleistophora hominis]|uniref:40S ribosomal protein S28 n=1 Tax=Trachipleistophora hominis TaxID=72359 RepID=L7K040_TRAHO|nr:40S ribosomal protein S28 [Trachipleistophora hominis]